MKKIPKREIFWNFFNEYHSEIIFRDNPTKEHQSITEKYNKQIKNFDEVFKNILMMG